MADRARPGQAEGVLVVDKPSGQSSHDVVNQLRRVYRTRRVGHAGTLDPMATGVLVMLLGEATKLSAVLTTQSKEYETTIELGVETDSLDADGQVTARRPVPEWSDAALEAALAVERQRRVQVPPQVSAIRVGGVRAYEKARKGEVAVLEPRDVLVHEMQLLGRTRTSLTVRLLVSKGYYVRALARDLCRELGTVGHLTHLRRVASGHFDLGRAVSLPLTEPVPLLPLATAAELALPTATVTEDTARRAAFGQPLERSELPGLPEAFLGRAALLHDGRLIALVSSESDSNYFRVLRGFVAPSLPEKPQV
jgi:tRNA pseudouridine55 synthase